MTLKITLKPGEPVFVGEAVLRVVSSSTSVLLIEGNSPVLRAEDFLFTPAFASPVDTMRMLLQKLYLSRHGGSPIDEFRKLSQEILGQQPTLAPFVEKLDRLLREGQLYRAVKEAKNIA